MLDASIQSSFRYCTTILTYMTLQKYSLLLDQPATYQSSDINIKWRSGSGTTYYIVQRWPSPTPTPTYLETICFGCQRLAACEGIGDCGKHSGFRTRERRCGMLLVGYQVSYADDEIFSPGDLFIANAWWDQCILLCIDRIPFNNYFPILGWEKFPSSFDSCWWQYQYRYRYRYRYQPQSRYYLLSCHPHLSSDRPMFNEPMISSH